MHHGYYRMRKLYVKHRSIYVWHLYAKMSKPCLRPPPPKCETKVIKNEKIKILSRLM